MSFRRKKNRMISPDFDVNFVSVTAAATINFSEQIPTHDVDSRYSDWYRLQKASDRVKTKRMVFN